MNYGPIKVINDDTQQPGGFVDNHEHKNYDIISYVVSGELEHTDSLGNVSRAHAGQIQRMWAGSSIWHTEACIGDTPARYLQIWITPNETNTPAEYQLYDRPTEFAPLPFQVKQDIKISAGILHSRSIVSKIGYVYVVDGTCVISGKTLTIGDGAEVDYDMISPLDECHIILFDFPDSLV
jgi:redox-sensitive bicupin YhaK (pirin superfamily)